MTRLTLRVASPSSRLALRLPADDEGFTLVEAIVSLLIATTAMMALTLSLLGAVKASALARDNQQAGDVLNQALEQSRAASYDSLAMRSADRDTSDTRTPALSACSCYNPTADSTSGSGLEPLVLDPAGSISPHVVTVNGTGALLFTVKKYVTLPTDTTGATYKRLSVVVSWTSRGGLHTRKVSTLIAPTKRGLPLPDFKFTTNGPSTACRNPGSSLVYAFTLKNNGARDAWQLTAAPWTPTWQYYQDVNSNLTYDSGVDTALPTDPGTGLPNTGLLDPTQTRRLLAVATVGSTVTTFTTTFTATSMAVPGFAQAQSTTTTVQTTTCGVAPSPAPPTCGAISSSAAANAQGSGTVTRYYLHNGVGTTNTTTQVTMPFNKAAPTSTTMWDYSTESSAYAGRLVVSGSTVDWRYQMPAQSKYKGDALVTLYVAGAAFTNVTSENFTATLDSVTAGGVVSAIGAVTVTGVGPFACSNGFKAVTLQISTPNSGVTVNASDYLRLRVVTSSANMQFGYDTTGYQATLDLPLFSGNG